jgi:HPt (histidine-containing phosphotransfer) domain-containing protein
MTVIDRAEALERVEGDVDLLRELVGLFLEDVPARIAEIRDAIERRDAGGLRSGAHSLKGAAANLSARAVSEAAQRLEIAGRDQDFTHVESAYAVLITEIDRLTHELAEFA